MIELKAPVRLRTAGRLAGVTVSRILQITTEANRLKAAGRPVITLGAGEPDFDTPDHIKAAAARAMAEGQTKYTALDGTAELKAAIQAKFARDNGLTFRPEQITVSAGAKQVLFNAMAATLDPGDEVLLVAPFWTSYADIVGICGGVPRVLPTHEADGFRLTAQTLERAITPRTRWLILNSPSNPSGAAYSAAALKALTAVLARHPHVWLACDDIYEHIVYDDLPFVTVVAVDPEVADRTLTVNGVSKAYAMTGWRIGYAAGPAELIKAMAVVQSQVTSCPSSVSQAAAIEALNGPQDGVAARRASFEARRDLVVGAMNAIPRLSCRRPEGAFYAYVGCAGWLGCKTPDGEVLWSDDDVCDYLLRRHDVAVVPGSAFGLSPYFRISYATSREELEEACARIAAAGAVLSLCSPPNLISPRSS